MKTIISRFGLLVWFMAAHAAAQTFEVIGTVWTDGGRFGEGFDFTGSYVLVAAGHSKLLRTVDISDPSSPTVVGNHTLTTATDETTRDVVVDGQYAYCSTNGDLIVLDITDPTQPIEIGWLGRGLGQIRRAGKTLYGGIGYGGETFHTIDVSDPTSPTLLGSVDMAWPGPTFLHLPLAIVGGGPYEPVRILDVSDPTSPTLKSTIHFPYLNGAAVRGDYLYLGEESNDAFHIYDISNASSPDLLREYGLPIGQPLSGQMQWLDHRLFILDEWGASIRYFDASDPLEPILGGYLRTDLGTSTHEFVVTPRYLYIVGDAGFSILSHTVPIGLSHFQVE